MQVSKNAVQVFGRFDVQRYHTRGTPRSTRSGKRLDMTGRWNIPRQSDYCTDDGILDSQCVRGVTGCVQAFTRYTIDL